MAQAQGTTGQAVDPKIAELDLAAVAEAAAYELKRQHPSVVFTSGRRDKVGQARAMASNIVKNRQWVIETYKDSEARAACQAWVDDHPEATTKEEIQEGLESVFDSITDAQLGKISKHLSGEAFDVQPIAPGAQATAIISSIRGLAGLDKFLEKEGGLIRWHAQFR